MSEPTVEQLKEKIDKGLKATIEKVLGRPITDGTLDDLRLELAEQGFKVIDMSRERSHIDQRSYERVLHEKHYFEAAAANLQALCVMNGIMVEIRRPEPQAAPLHPMYDPRIPPSMVFSTDKYQAEAPPETTEAMKPANGKDTV